MRFVIQRVSKAAVSVDDAVVGQIEKGFLALIGIGQGDTEETAQKMIRKMLALRIFEDENGKTNRSLADVGGGLLLVSQFTLYANCKKGNRPSFTDSAPADLARSLYEYIVKTCMESGQAAACGIFGADMKVSLVNDGPFTVVLDSEQI